MAFRAKGQPINCSPRSFCRFEFFFVLIVIDQAFSVFIQFAIKLVINFIVNIIIKLAII